VIWADGACATILDVRDETKPAQPGQQGRNADMEWSLPLGNLQGKVKWIGLVYGVGLIISAQTLSLAGRGILTLAALPGLILLVSLKRSGSWASSQHLRVRNAWVSDVCIDRSDVGRFEWYRVTGLGLGYVCLVSHDGSKHRLLSTLGTNGSWCDLEAALKSTLEHAG
jgi:hypothetical protein